MHQQKILKVSSIRPWLSWLFIAVIFAGIAYYANFRSDNIYDPDSFYHIRHAWIYQQKGIFYTDLPWAQYSAIKELKADLWYGLHIVYLPFTFFEDLTFGIKIIGFFTTFFVLWSVFWALRHLRINFPAFWSSFFIFSSPIILSRMAMTRPHPLSLGLFTLIFSFLIRGPWWPVFIFSFFAAWIHSSLSWFPLIIFGVVFIFKKINGRKENLSKFAALISGLATGLLARPHPIANLQLIYIQIIKLYASKKEVLDLIIGGELNPPTLGDVISSYTFLAIILAVSIFLLVKSFYKKEERSIDFRIAALGSLVLTSVSVLMYVNANRAIDILAVFTVIFSATAISPYFSGINKEKTKTLAVLGILALAFVIFTAYNSVRISKETYLANTKLRTAFKEPALWLQNNTKEGEIVFHLIWSQFPILFFWNQHNYYINGMDPVFLYAYDQELYWKLFYMWPKDMAGLTCNSINCGPENIEPVYDVLVKNFKASYVFVRKPNHPRFREYLESDKKHFEKVYDEGSSLIYKVLPPKPLKTTGKSTQ